MYTCSVYLVVGLANEIKHDIHQGNRCIERKIFFKNGGEVKRLKECALALKLYVYIRTRQSTRYRETVSLWWQKIKQYTTSKEAGLQNEMEHHISNKYKAVKLTIVSEK